MVLVVAGLMGGSWTVTYLAGGAGTIPPQLFYVPILLAAAEFGFVGAVITALLSGILAGPLMPLHAASSDPQLVSDWVTRTGFFVGMGLIVAALMARRDQAERRLRKTLDTLQTLSEQRERLLARLLATEERERRKVALDLHDDAVQVLVAVGMRLDLLAREAPPEERPETFRALRDTIGACIDRLRHLLFDLYPPELEEHGLGEAVRRYLDGLKSQGRLDYRLDAALAAEPSPQLGTLVYRILQEALTNVAKHAEASFVEVQLEQADGGLRGRVVDDGTGLSLDPDHDARPGHLGLQAMRERAELAGGRCEIVSPPEGGTVVSFWVPGSFELEELPDRISLSQLAG